MSEKSIANVINIDPPILIRYVKPSYIVNGEVGEEIFQLREDRSPPEEYISFFHSKKATIDEKINDIRLILEKRKFKIKKTSGFIFLNILNALEDINATNDIILFKEEDYPHYGMYYVSDEDMDIQEAKTILLYHYELYLNANLEKVVSVKAVAR